MLGFVYIWRDAKHGRYYIGSHVGDENDRYVCSSKTMKQAHMRRPHDFKRRILFKGDCTREALLNEEVRWLMMIGDDELNKKYYNKVKRAFGSPSEVYSHLSKRSWTPERKAAYSKRMTGKKNPEHSARMKAKWDDPAFLAKINRSESNKKAWSNDDARRERQSARASSHVKSDAEREAISQKHLANARRDPALYAEKARKMREARVAKGQVSRVG